METSALPAQYGYHSSAAVNAVTKSGGNDFHGDVFEFLRNGDLNARANFFAVSRDTAEAQSNSAARWADPSRRTSYSFSPAIKAPSSVPIRSTARRLCPLPRCWPGISPPRCRPVATAAGLLRR